MSPKALYRENSRTVAHDSKIGRCGSGVVYHAFIPDRPLWDVDRWGSEDGEDDEWSDHSPKSRSERRPAILFVNRQVYAEAAPIFYRTNLFRLRIGISPHIDCREWKWDLVDDLTSIKHENLKLIRRMHLKVRIFDSSGAPSSVLSHGLDNGRVPIEDRDWWWPKEYSRSSYLAVTSRLKAFADQMRAEHSLLCLRIYYDGWVLGRPLDRKYYQTVLEPLATIFGIPKVQALGVRRNFARKIARAMKAEFLAVEEIPEAYGTRIIRRKGKTVEERYKLRAYYDSRYKFLLEWHD
ncbi:MAG: hypothetical protein Q9211_003893 [Gyalolechia sp. 1 TL-2023]